MAGTVDFGTLGSAAAGKSNFGDGTLGGMTGGERKGSGMGIAVGIDATVVETGVRAGEISGVKGEVTTGGIGVDEMRVERGGKRKARRRMSATCQ